MKRISSNLYSLLLICLMLINLPANAQKSDALRGAWESKAGDNSRLIAIFQDGYLTISAYSADEFKFSTGGPYTVEGNRASLVVEFASDDKERVGKSQSHEFKISGDQLLLLPEKRERELKFQRIDDGKAPLAGVWQITDRMQEGELVPIQRSGTRKTLKMLTGNRFQWFAIDPATKLFAGTGGGTYTFKDGKYTENIEFFSRDNSRVGASLSFDGELKDGKWHHSGFSSKGDEIYEVWGRGE